MTRIWIRCRRRSKSCRRGVLEVLPIDNADGEWVNLGLCTKGYRPPYQVRRVRTTTVAGLVGIWD
jgi:hypothetical protein